MEDKDLNLFDKCAAECVCLFPQEEKCSSFSWGDSEMYTAGTIANLQMWMLTKAKKNVGGCQSKNFSGTRDTVRHLKTFRVIYWNVSFTSYLMLMLF